MLWQDRRESANVEDRRGMGGKTVVGGIGTLIFMLVVYLLGGNPLQVLQQVQQNAPQTSAQQTPADDKTTRFVRTILADTEDFWGRTFNRLGSRYSDPTLVLFNGTTQSGCGFANAATGPFYSPFTIYDLPEGLIMIDF